MPYLCLMFITTIIGFKIMLFKIFKESAACAENTHQFAALGKRCRTAKPLIGHLKLQ